MYAAGDGAGLTGFSGGRYWRITRFPERSIQVAVPKRRRAQAGFQIVPTLLLPGESFVRDAIPVCTVEVLRQLAAQDLARGVSR